MNPVDWKTALDGVDPTTILLPIVVLTLPCVAAAVGLKKISQPSPSKRGGKLPAAAAAAAAKPAGNGKKSKFRLLPTGVTQRLWARLLALLTAVAWAGAGLGLVPLGLVVFKAVEHTSKWTPLVVGAGLVLILLATFLKMIKDLKDGVVDKPGLWATAAPILAVLVLVGPGLWSQVTNQAKETTKMMFGQSSPSEHGDKPTKPEHPSSGRKAHDESADKP